MLSYGGISIVNYVLMCEHIPLKVKEWKHVESEPVSQCSFFILISLNIILNLSRKFKMPIGELGVKSIIALGFSFSKNYSVSLFKNETSLYIILKVDVEKNVLNHRSFVYSLFSNFFNHIFRL